MRTYWLKSVGSTDDPQVEDWVISAPQELTEVRFPAKGKPAVRVGDYLVYYAPGHEKVIGIVEVNGLPTDDTVEMRWPWRCQIRPHLVLGSIERAPSIDVLSDPERDFRASGRQQSHVAITEEQYDRALVALEAVFDATKGDMLDSGPFFKTRLTRRPSTAAASTG